jgi:hypothetical protein
MRRKDVGGGADGTRSARAGALPGQMARLVCIQKEHGVNGSVQHLEFYSRFTIVFFLRRQLRPLTVFAYPSSAYASLASSPACWA